MNEELQQALTRFLDRLLTAAEQGSDVAIEQAPLVLQEYLAWGFWGNIIEAMTVIGPCLLFFVLGLRWFKRIDFDADDMPNEVPLAAGAGALTILFGIGVFVVSVPSLMTAAQVVIAPRVYLIEQIKDLVS